MKQYTKIISLALFFILNVSVANAQSSGGYDVLGIWAYVTLDESTPVVDGYYEIVFPTPPEGVVEVDGPGIPATFYTTGNGYTYVYMRKNQLDLVIAEANKNQIEFEVYINRTTNIPSISEGAQCYYFVVLCLPGH